MAGALRQQGRRARAAILGIVGAATLATASTSVAQPRRAQQPLTTPPERRPQSPGQDPCAGVSCGAHGVCVPESETPYCFCDEGWAALGQRCVRAPRPTGPRPPAAVSEPGARAVAIALAEDGRDLASVGREREASGLQPGALARYVTRDGLWCSDFVSWVYRAAGVPFTGGYEGGWLLTNNAAIRRWFERRGAWLDRTHPGYRSFTPQPGDYVRVSTPTWGHSAIVRAVEGDTLHAIEGNARGRVHLVRYRRFRDHERIEGFGLLRLAHAYRPRRS